MCTVHVSLCIYITYIIQLYTLVFYNYACMLHTCTNKVICICVSVCSYKLNDYVFCYNYMYI